MGLLTRWLMRSNKSDEPQISWGRFSDAYKTKEQYKAWDQSQEYFESDDVIPAIHSFVDYIQHGDKGNAFFTDDRKNCQLTIYQGSCKLTANVDEEMIKAEVTLAKGSHLNTFLLHLLLTDNYEMRYCRYALGKQGEVKLIFDSYLVDLNAYKLYYAFKELALKADKRDDLLLDEWKDLIPVDNDHIVLNGEGIANSKLCLLRNELLKLKILVEDDNSNWLEFKHGLTYIVLSTVYKLDYLLSPQGKLMEVFNKVHQIYFNEKPKDRESQNNRALELLREISNFSDEDIISEFYEAKVTFGGLQAVNVEEVAQLILTERDNLAWYSNRDHDSVVNGLLGFIVGYALYNYAPPPPVKDALELFYRLTNPEFFMKCGFIRMMSVNGKVDMKKLKSAMDKIISGNKEEFPYLQMEDISDYKATLLGVGEWLMTCICNMNLLNYENE